MRGGLRAFVTLLCCTRTHRRQVGVPRPCVAHSSAEEFPSDAVELLSYFDPVRALQALRQVSNQRLPAQTCIYLCIGAAQDAEGKAPADVERLHELLRRQLPNADQVTLCVVEGAGHNEPAWRAELPRALRWAFELEAAAARP